MTARRTIVSVLLLAAGAMLFAGPLGAADCLRPVGELPEGPSLAVDMVGSLAAFGRGRVLVLVDLSDPSDPVELGSAVLPGVVQSVELTADHAWVAAGLMGLIGVDVSDPRQPEVVSALPAGLADEDATAIDLALSGGLAFVTETVKEPNWTSRARLRIVDVSAPASPADVGVWESEEDSDAGAVAVAGGLALVMDSQGLGVIDVSNPSQPTEIGRAFEGGSRYDLAVSSATVFVLGRSGVTVLDITDPRHPAVAARLSTGRDDRTLVVDGELLFVGGPRGWGGNDPFGAWVYDISPPWLPTEIGFVETPTPVVGLAAGGGILLAATGRTGLRVVDVADPAQPVETASLRARDSAWWVTTSGSLALVARYSPRNHEMTLVDISDAANPVELGELSLPFAPSRFRPSLEGSLAFVGSDSPSGIAVFDVSDPGAPQQLTFLHLPWDPRSLDAAGSRLYAVSGGELLVVDASDPASPALIGEVDASETGPAVLVAADGDLVTVVNESCPWGSCAPSILIFDVGSSAQPELLDTMRYPQAYGIAPRGGFLFFAGGSDLVFNGLVVVDSSDPTWLREVAGIELEGMVFGMDVGAGMAFVSAYTSFVNNAIDVVNVRDPFHPQLVTRYLTPGPAFDLVATGNLVLVAAGNAGLLLLDATECAFPPPRHPAGRLAPGSPSRVP